MTVQRRITAIAGIVGLLGLWSLAQPEPALAMSCLGPGQYVCLDDCPIGNQYCSTCPTQPQVCEEVQFGCGGKPFVVYCFYEE